MQATLIGVTRMSGVGKESKQPYDMVRALMLNPIEGMQKEGFSRTGAGFEPVEVDLSVEAFEFFKTQKYPLTADLETSTAVKGGKVVTLIIGVVRK